MLDIRPGSWVGPYKVIAPLEEAARGGTASLFLAQLARLEGTQLVILKIVPVEDEGYDERGALRLDALRKEVETLQKLRHPNIVKIYPIPSRNGPREHYIARATNVPGNPWFCAMEHLGEDSLESRLRELTVLPLGEAVEIAYQIGSALDYMHSKGYAHWDIKPDNILFRYDLSRDGLVEAVLTDFGIARENHEPAVVAGTRWYISPERVRLVEGEIALDQIIDQRPADVFALGMVLYEMLAGELPFPGSEKEVKYAILGEPPIPLTDFNYEVPVMVEDTIFQALEKNPANRPTMEEMLNMLDRTVPAPRIGIQPLLVSGAAPAPVPVGAGVMGTTAVGRPARARPSAAAVERRKRKPSPIPAAMSGPVPMRAGVTGTAAVSRHVRAKPSAETLRRQGRKPSLIQRLAPGVALTAMVAVLVVAAWLGVQRPGILPMLSPRPVAIAPTSVPSHTLASASSPTPTPTPVSTATLTEMPAPVSPMQTPTNPSLDEIGQLRRDMNERFERMESRLDNMTGQFNERFDNMTGQFNQRFDNMTSQFNGRFDNMTNEFSKRFDNMTGQFSERFDKIYGLLIGTFIVAIGALITGIIGLVKR